MKKEIDPKEPELEDKTPVDESELNEWEKEIMSIDNPSLLNFIKTTCESRLTQGCAKACAMEPKKKGYDNYSSYNPPSKLPASPFPTEEDLDATQD